MNTELSEFEYKVAEVLNSVSSGVSNPEQWLIDMMGGGQSTSSGVNVGVSKALGLPSVWNSIFRIGGHIGALPVEIRRPIGGTSSTSVIIPNHPAGTVLNGPNPRQTGQILRETMMAHALLEGNARAVILRNNVGQPVELLLIPPAYVWSLMWYGVKWHIINLPYHYLDPEEIPPPDGVVLAPDAPNFGQYRVHDDDVLHIPGLSYDGLWGISLLHNSRDIFGIDVAGQDATGYSFQNNGRPGLLLEAPQNQLTKAKDAKEFIDDFNKMHQGIDNAGRTGLLRAGMKAHVLPISAQDAQHIENRRFSREDIALLFGTESVMGEGSAVYKDRQDRMVAYLQNCLMRWFQRWNYEAQRKLFSSRDRASGVFLKFDVQPLLAGDPNTLADYTGKLVQQKVVTTNEVRAMHNLNPVPDGNELVGAPTMEDTVPETTEGTPEPPDTNDTQNRQMLRIARNAVNKVFQQKISREIRRIKSASNHPKTFLERLDVIYADCRSEFEEACIEYDIPPELAHRHCDDSVLTLSQLAGSTAGNLKEHVCSVVEDWKLRAETFSNAIV